MIALICIAGVLIGLVANVLSYRSLLEGVMDGLISLAFGSLISAAVMALISEGGGHLTLRRSFGLTLFGMFFMGLVIIIGAAAIHLALMVDALEKIFAVCAGALIAYEVILLYAITELRGAKLMLAGALQPFTVFSFHIIVAYATGMVAVQSLAPSLMLFAATLVVAYVLGIWYYQSLNSVGRNVIGYGTIEIFKAFLNVWLGGKADFMEEVLLSQAIRRDAEVKMYRLSGRGGEKAAVVAPLIHPGPFRDFGGSKLPTRMTQALLDAGTAPVIFHTPTTHDRDLVLTKDCGRIIGEMLAQDCPAGSSLASKVAVRKRGNITVTCQVLDGIPLIVISRAPLPTEDLPESVYRRCMKKVLENGYSDGVVVDAHNSMETAYTDLSGEDMANIEAACDEALKAVWEGGKGVLSAGFNHSELSRYSRREGIGGGGIMTFVSEVNGQKFAYIAIDGNNMISGLREEIQAELRKRGYESEITTTDTHVVAGLSTGEGYFPLGKAIPREVLVEAVAESVKAADSKKGEYSVKYCKVRVEDVYFLGAKGIENLWRATDESVRSAKRKLMVLIPVLAIACIALFAFL